MHSLPRRRREAMLAASQTQECSVSEAWERRSLHVTRCVQRNETHAFSEFLMF